MKKELYVSYAWGGQSETVYNKISVACVTNKIKLTSDKTDLNFRELISSFMQRLGQSNHVVVVISDRYLKSANCMFELLEISKNGDFKKRIFPIVLKSASIYDPLGIIKYIKYWERKIDALNLAMSSLTNHGNLQGIRNTLDLYIKIRELFASITDILKDMKCERLDFHLANDFQLIFDSVKARKKNP
ncbi:MAG: toll/interleukin-1 receptor domain-containing protein [Dyadobacter sp.]